MEVCSRETVDGSSTSANWNASRRYDNLGKIPHVAVVAGEADAVEVFAQRDGVLPRRAEDVADLGDGDPDSLGL